jgi:hypothetical protein
MDRRIGVRALALLVSLSLWTSTGNTAEMTKELAVKYLLMTVHAFRTVFDESVLLHLQAAGIEPKENWQDDQHASMLPFQFIKLAGASIKEFDIGIISLTPLYSSNFPKTEAEAGALKSLIGNPNKSIMTFADGDQFKGLMADFATNQSCADCHNHHPNSVRKDFRKGDLMGAIVIRLKK